MPPSKFERTGTLANWIKKLMSSDCVNATLLTVGGGWMAR